MLILLNLIIIIRIFLLPLIDFYENWIKKKKFRGKNISQKQFFRIPFFFFFFFTTVKVAYSCLSFVFLIIKWHRFFTTANGTTSLKKEPHFTYLTSPPCFNRSSYFTKWNGFGARNMRAVRYRSVLLNEFSHKSSSHREPILKAIEEPCSFLRDLMGKVKGQGTKRLLLINSDKRNFTDALMYCNVASSYEF